MNLALPILLLSLLLSVLFAADKALPPGVAGLYVGMPRAELMDTLARSPIFKAADITTDSNTVMIAARGREVLAWKKTAFSSIKCMFNKKKEIQALSVVFPAQIVDAVQAVYAAAADLLGKPEKTTAAKPGFKFEAEWRFSRYAASFFASDVDFEAYLLIAFQSFVREEELRGEQHPR